MFAAREIGDIGPATGGDQNNASRIGAIIHQYSMGPINSGATINQIGTTIVD